MWTGRILLEAQYQRFNSSFVTLTYDEKYLPDRGSLDTRDLAQFTNRLRARGKINAAGNLRFFAVGEYGTQTWRPHYHLSLFGIEPELESEIKGCWDYGHVHVGEVSPESASYIAGYTTKKMTSVRDERILDTGLHPEFNRMSRYPPLGAAGMERAILPALMTRPGAIAIAERGDVPSSFKLHGRTWPVGKYWRTWLRKQIGITQPPEYAPWIIDPDQFEQDKIHASKKAELAFKKAKSGKSRTL